VDFAVTEFPVISERLQFTGTDAIAEDTHKNFTGSRFGPGYIPDDEAGAGQDCLPHVSLQW
jgi:hypothetical protein